MLHRTTAFLLLLAIFSMIFTANAIAEIQPPNCIEPVKPLKLSKNNYQSWDSDIAKYKKCLDDYAAAENEMVNKLVAAAKPHRDAAMQAIQQWNAFAVKEMKSRGVEMQMPKTDATLPATTAPKN
jgi:Skp family chaperone for outer membrane proteins